MVSTINGYRTVQLPLCSPLGATHSLYIKAHASRGGESSSGTTLFVGNVDYTTESMEHTQIDEYLKCLLSRFGAIRHISISTFPENQTNANTRFAHVEFTKKSSLKLALVATERDYFEAGKEVASKFGSSNYEQLQNEPKSSVEIKRLFPFIDEDPDELKEEVDNYMRDFEESELIAKIEREQKLNEVDDDGFMPVKNRNKRKR